MNYSTFKKDGLYYIFRWHFSNQLSCF